MALAGLLLGAMVIAHGATVEAKAPLARTYVLSIVGVSLGPDEYIREFTVDTWGVTYKSVCRIPPGWTISAGSTAAPDGRFGGAASHGITFIDRAHLGLLKNLLLVTVYGPVRPRAVHYAQAETPPTFDGAATIGTYGGSDRTRKVRLGYRDIRLTAARACQSQPG